jgi:hypothetical protein
LREVGIKDLASRRLPAMAHSTVLGARTSDETKHGAAAARVHVHLRNARLNFSDTTALHLRRRNAAHAGEEGAGAQCGRPSGYVTAEFGAVVAVATSRAASASALGWSLVAALGLHLGTAPHLAGACCDVNMRRSCQSDCAGSEELSAAWLSEFNSQQRTALPVEADCAPLSLLRLLLAPLVAVLVAQTFFPRGTAEQDVRRLASPVALLAPLIVAELTRASRSGRAV